MDSPLDAPAGGGSRYCFSLTRVAAVAFTVFVLAVAYGAYVDYFVKDRGYEATSEILIRLPRDPNRPEPGPMDFRSGNHPAFSIQGDIECLSSPDVLEQIVTDFQLEKIWARREKLVIDALPMQDALRRFRSMLRVERMRDSGVIAITVESVVPKEASDLANAVADRYESVRDLEARQDIRHAIQLLEAEIAQQKTVVAQKTAAVDAIHAQLEAHGIHIAPGAAGLIAADLAAQKSGSTSRIDALAPLRDAQAQLDKQQGVLDDLTVRKSQDEIDETMVNSPVQIIALAEPPEYPSLPNHEFNMWIAVIVGLALAIAAPLLMELWLRYLGNLPRPGDPPMLPRPVLTSAEY